jgi:hypothetical protein
LGDSKQKLDEEKRKEKIEEYKEIQRVCGYCDHYFKQQPNMSGLEHVAQKSLQTAYQSGNGPCNLHDKMVQFLDCCPDYYQDPLGFAILLGANFDSVESLDKEIKRLKKIRGLHKTFNQKDIDKTMKLIKEMGAGLNK